MDITIISSVAAGSALFGYIMNAVLTSFRNKSPEVLDAVFLADIQIPDADKDIINVFKKSVKNRIQMATEKGNATKKTIERIEGEHKDTKKKINAIVADLEKAYKGILAKKSKGAKNIAIQVETTVLHQKLGAEQMNIARESNSLRKLYNVERFWKEVKEGSNRPTAYDNLVDMSNATQEYVTKIEAMLEAMHNSSMMGEEVSDNIMSIWEEVQE